MCSNTASGPCRASCWRSELGHPPERGVPRFGPTAPVDTRLTNPGATTSQTRPQEPLNVATRTNALVDHQRHNPSLTCRYGVLDGADVATAERALHRANNLHLARFELCPARGPPPEFAQRVGRVAQTRDASSRPRTGWPCCCSWRKHSVR